VIIPRVNKNFRCLQHARRLVHNIALITPFAKVS
jgi:hypothetical protein